MAETTPSSARVDRAVAPTAEEAKAANAGEYAPRGANRFLYNASRNLAVRLGLMGVAGVAAYQNVPAVHEFVDSKLFHAGESASNPDVFDPQQEIIDLTRQNTTAISPEEIGNFTKIESPDFDTMETFTTSDPNFPRYRTEQPMLEIPLPFEIPENSKVILRYSESNLGFGYGTTGVKDKIAINGLPKNTIIYAPVDGKFVFKQSTEAMLGTVTMAYIDYEDNDGNLRILGFELGTSKSLIDTSIAPNVGIAPNTDQGATVWEQRDIVVKQGTPLFTIEDATGTSNRRIADQLTIDLSPSFGNKNREAVYYNGKPLMVYSPLAIATLDNKAIVIENK